MKESIQIAPPNALVLVMDHAFGVLPNRMGSALVASTPSCVAIGTLADVDGETAVTLTDEWLDFAPADLFFDGVLEVPSRELSICNARNEKLMTVALSADTVRVLIYANDASEADEITVLVGG